MERLQLLGPAFKTTFWSIKNDSKSINRFITTAAAVHINFILIHLSLFLKPRYMYSICQPYDFRYFLWKIISFLSVCACKNALLLKNYKLLLWRQNHNGCLQNMVMVAVYQRGTTTTGAFPHQTVVDSPKCGSQNTWRLQAKTLHLSVATSIAKCRHWRRCHWQVLSFVACPTATRVHHNWNFENGLLVDNNNFYRHCFHDV